MKDKSIEDKYKELENLIEELVEEGVCIAFSGGVD